MALKMRFLPFPANEAPYHMAKLVWGSSNGVEGESEREPMVQQDSAISLDNSKPKSGRAVSY
jgi:hypothetical protein